MSRTGRPERTREGLLFPVLVLVVTAVYAQGSRLPQNYFPSFTFGGGNTGYVHRNANGDLVITVPRNTTGRYKIRFFDEHGTLLFEIRQIRDPLLIVEKYNFEHAGQFFYELYRDAVLIEKMSFSIRR